MSYKKQVIKEAIRILIERHITEYDLIYQKKLKEIKKAYIKDYKMREIKKWNVLQ